MKSLLLKFIILEDFVVFILLVDFFSLFPFSYEYLFYSVFVIWRFYGNYSPLNDVDHNNCCPHPCTPPKHLFHPHENTINIYKWHFTHILLSIETRKIVQFAPHLSNICFSGSSKPDGEKTLIRSQIKLSSRQKIDDKTTKDSTADKEEDSQSVKR